MGNPKAWKSILEIIEGNEKSKTNCRGMYKGERKEVAIIKMKKKHTKNLLIDYFMDTILHEPINQNQTHFQDNT